MRPLRPALAVLALFALGHGAEAADADAGSRVFKSQCGSCHVLDKGKKGTGPSLLGIVGRASGSVPGYKYSAANQNAKLVWDAATLDKYLTKPSAVVPGTTMTYAGLRNDAQRADLIAYLATLK